MANKILKIGEYLKSINENNDFKTKMEEKLEINDIVKTITTLTVELLKNTTFDDFDDFQSYFFDNLSLDETNLLDLTLDEKLDLCIYAEDDMNKCPTTEWINLENVIEQYALKAMRILCENVINLYDIKTFVEENNLTYTINHDDPYSMASPKSINNIKNGRVIKYRNLDGDFNVDVYNFKNEIFNIYFVKKL